MTASVIKQKPPHIKFMGGNCEEIFSGYICAFISFKS